MKKSILTVVIILWIIMLPFDKAKANVEIGFGSVNRGIYKDIPYYFELDRGISQNGVKILFSYKDLSADCILQYGHTWYDKENLLFSESVNMW